MKNKNNLPLYFSLAVIFGIFMGLSVSEDSFNLWSFSKSSSQEIKIKKLINFIKKEYVDTVDTENLLDVAINEMLGELDPHSTYIPKENLQAVQERMQGNF